MKYKLTLIGLLLIPAIIFTQSPNATARGEHEGGGGAAPAAAPAHMAAPAPRMAAPAASMRMAAPPQRSFTPAAPRAFAPAEQRSFAPQRSFSQAPRQMSHSNREFSSAPSAQTERYSSAGGSSHQLMPRHMQQAIAPNNRPNREAGNINRNGQGKSELSASGRDAGSRSLLSGHPANGELARGQQLNSNTARNSEHMSSYNAGQLASMEGAKAIRGSVGRANAYANPRRVGALRAGMAPHFSANRPGNLSYRAGAGNIPRAGRVGVGRAGIKDPGGYIRTPGNGTRGINRNSIQQQISSLPNYNNNYNSNNRLRNGNQSQWPGGWNPGPNAGNLGYYPGYSYNGINYPFNYFACQGYCPTPWLFMLNSGAFWQPGMGYAENLPYGYNQPISIAVDEVVPNYDAYGNIIGYQDETFYYNASWDPNTQAYGYYDYRGVFHWTTFPWLNTWMG